MLPGRGSGRERERGCAKGAKMKSEVNKEKKGDKEGNRGISRQCNTRKGKFGEFRAREKGRKKEVHKNRR